MYTVILLKATIKLPMGNFDIPDCKSHITSNYTIHQLPRKSNLCKIKQMNYSPDNILVIVCFSYFHSTGIQCRKSAVFIRQRGRFTADGSLRSREGVTEVAIGVVGRSVII